jgi:hypothetical protein
VCSGVVGVLLDELLPPPVPLASPVLGIARPVAEQAMVSQWFTVMAGIPSGSPAREGADADADADADVW